MSAYTSVAMEGDWNDASAAVSVSEPDEPVGTVVVLTALGEEYQAVRSHLAEVELNTHPTGTLFEVGWLSGAARRVALAQIGEGNQAAAVLAERSIAWFHPAALLFVGIAGALRDGVELGDVVVGTRIYAFHGGREDSAGFYARPRVWEAPHAELQLAQHLGREGLWASELPAASRSRPPAVHFGSIAAGEVVLDSRDSPVAERLRRNYNDVVAIETESAGAALAGHLNGSVPVLAVRGISDRADGAKSAADRAGWRPRAAAHAAAFAAAFCTRLPEAGPAALATPPALLARQIVVPAAARTAPQVGQWEPGAEILVGDRRYLLHDHGVAELTSVDGAVRWRQARALRLPPPDPPRPEYAWLRQAELHRGVVADQAGRAARSELAALVRERNLLYGLSEVARLPRVGAYAADARSAILAVGWPACRSTRAPCESLADLPFLNGGGQLDRWRLYRLLAGFAELCDTLARLHQRGVAHRNLCPAGMIALDDGRLVLRDLGLAGFDHRPGEGPVHYQAPEQRRRGPIGGAGRIGPGTDVYQLAAVVYHLVAGQPPDPAGPLPVRPRTGPAPERFSHALAAALAPDPRDRPDIRALATAFRAAQTQIC